MANKTKYFITGTDEEVLMGDVIETTLEKLLDNGVTITRNVEFTVDEENIPYALGLNIISTEPTVEEDEDEEENDTLEFVYDGLKDFREAVAEDIDDLMDRVTALEETVAELTAQKKK